MKRFLRVWAAGLAAAASSLALAAPLHFALIGDAPYNRRESIAFEQMIEDINADRDIALVLHAGDIKGSGEPCTDALLAERLAQLAHFARPLIYTPGDNEWTDCHRPRAGRFLPTERLAALRRIAYLDPRRSLGRPSIPLATQADDPAWAEFVENSMAERDGLLFVALHVVGSGNGREAWRGIDSSDSNSQPRPDRMAEITRREAAASAWIDAAFARARRDRLAGVVVLMQAHPQIEKGEARRAPFQALLDQLEARAREFARPVLLAHGDEHEFFHDSPLAGAPNLQRVQSFGSPVVHWVEVVFDPTRSPAFRFRPRHVRIPGEGS